MLENLEAKKFLVNQYFCIECVRVKKEVIEYSELSRGLSQEGFISPLWMRWLWSER